MQIIYEGPDYRVIHFRPNTNIPVTIVFFEYWRAHFNAVSPSEFEVISENNFLTNHGLNCFFVQSRRNDWFQAPGIDTALASIKALKSKEEKYIGYGSSMGGYAAIAFGPNYGADYFVATAPQASLSADFVSKIGEYRWRDAWPIFHRDLIRTRQEGATRGLVFVDPQMEQDRLHVSEIEKRNTLRIFECPGTWHHPGRLIQREYGLARLLAHISERISSFLEVDAFIDEIEKKTHQSPAALFMRSSGHDRVKMLAVYGGK